MKVSPHRRVRKYLNFYKNNFDFKTPYQIVVDETFCLEALTCQLNFKEQAPKYLEDENTKFFTTTCAVKATKKLGLKGADALKILQELEVKSCDHDVEPSTECLFSLVRKNNPDRLFVATQDHQLVHKCRSVASVPILYIMNNAVCLENPESSRTVQVKRKATEDGPKPKRKPRQLTASVTNSDSSFPSKIVHKTARKKFPRLSRNTIPDSHPFRIETPNKGEQKKSKQQKWKPVHGQKNNLTHPKSNVGHGNKFGGQKEKAFQKQFK